MTRVLRVQLHRGPYPLNPERSPDFLLIAKAQNGHRVSAFIEMRQFLCEVLDVHAGATVDGRWIFVGENSNAHTFVFRSTDGRCCRGFRCYGFPDDPAVCHSDAVPTASSARRIIRAPPWEQV